MGRWLALAAQNLMPDKAKLLELAHDFARLSDHFAVQREHQQGTAEAASAAMQKAYKDAATRLLALLDEGKVP